MGLPDVLVARGTVLAVFCLIGVAVNGPVGVLVCH